jgi:hypothetical protein
VSVTEVEAGTRTTIEPRMRVRVPSRYRNVPFCENVFENDWPGVRIPELKSPASETTERSIVSLFVQVIVSADVDRDRGRHEAAPRDRHGLRGGDCGRREREREHRRDERQESFHRG